MSNPTPLRHGPRFITCLRLAYKRIWKYLQAIKETRQTQGNCYRKLPSTRELISDMRLDSIIPHFSGPRGEGDSLKRRATATGLDIA